VSYLEKGRQAAERFAKTCEDFCYTEQGAQDARQCLTVLDTLEKKGFVTSVESAEQVQDILHDKFVESKLFVLQQAPLSRTEATSSKPERVLLPRALDTITHLLRLVCVNALWASDYDIVLPSTEDADVEGLVLDISDAFWSVPLAPKERRFFVCRCRAHGTDLSHGVELCH